MPLHPYATPSCALTTIAVTTDFARNAKVLAENSKALGSIATDDSKTPTLAYDDLWQLPQIVRPLVKAKWERKDPRITKEEVLGEELYRGVLGSGFGKQHEFLYGLSERKLHVEDSLPKSIAAISFDGPMIAKDVGVEQAREKPELELQAAAMAFLKGLRCDAAEANLFSVMYYDAASERFNRLGLHGATAIAQYLKFEAFVRENKFPTLKEVQEVSRLKWQYGSKASHSFLKALIADEEEKMLGLPYQYGLYLAHWAREWFLMQGFFMQAGKVHEARGLTEEARKAYITSVFAFASGKEQIPVEYDKALEALTAAEYLGPPELRSERVIAMKMELEGKGDISLH